MTKQLVPQKTYNAKPGELKEAWWIIDAEGQTLGRLATEVANMLRGKHKPQYTPHIDTGDHVIIINADKIKVTGKKMTDKIYYRHSGYIGNLKKTSMKHLLEKHPTQPLEKAIWGMLPHNRLGRQQIKKLFAYTGTEHPHQAQQPQPYEIK